MNDEKVLTTAQKYKERFGSKFKTVTLPSGEVFKLRKLVLADFMVRTMVPLGFVSLEDMKTWAEKSVEEREAIIQKNTTPENNAQFNRELVAWGVDSPRLTTEKEAGPDEISVYDLDDADAKFLLDEVMKFSGMAKEGREEITPFPAGERKDA